MTDENTILAKASWSERCQYFDLKNNTHYYVVDLYNWAVFYAHSRERAEQERDRLNREYPENQYVLRGTVPQATDAQLRSVLGEGPVNYNLEKKWY